MRQRETEADRETVRESVRERDGETARDILYALHSAIAYVFLAERLCMCK